MKKLLNIFFVTLGIIFFIIILIAAYLFIADPFNLKPLFYSDQAKDPSTAIEVEGEDTTVDESREDKSPVLNATQEKALEAVGIDPAKVPAKISPEQEACFTDILGTERVAEIKAGATPTATEIFTARGCLQ